MNSQRDDRVALHSGDYVNTLAQVPISRMTRLIPMMDLRSDDYLVDFGCGTGVLAHLVHKKISLYEGVDFSPDFIAEAQRLAQEAGGDTNAIFHCEDISTFCSAHLDEYDVVTALDFSEHIDDETFVAIFSGAYRTLKPGGRLFVYTPNLDFFWERMKDAGLARQFPQHIAVRNDRHHLDLLQKCGFRPENIEGYRLPHFNVFRHLHPLRHLPLLGRWFEAKLFYRCTK